MARRSQQQDAGVRTRKSASAGQQATQDTVEAEDAQTRQAAPNGTNGAAPDGLGNEAGALAAAAVVGVGAALLEAELIPGILIGAGAVLLGKMFPQAGTAVRPLLKTAVRAGLAVADKAREVVAEAGEQVQDVIAEVQAERVAEDGEAPRPARRRTTAARGTAAARAAAS